MAVLCFTLDVNSDGTYSKGRGRITERVVRVDADRLAGDRDPDAPVPKPRETSEFRVTVGRTTGWVVALLLCSLILAIAFIGTSFFMREHHEGQVRQQLQRIEKDVEALQTQQLETERRLVEMETQIDRLRER